MRDILRSLPRGPAVVIAFAAILLVVNNWRSETSASSTSLLLCLAIALVALLSGAVPRASRRRFAAVTVAMVVSLSVATVAAEYATRWVFRDVTTTADARGYFSKRWSRSGSNSFGFREREFGERKEPHVFRIAVIGDSFAYGNGLAAERRFSNLMQEALPKSFEVLNFGVPGDNTPEHATLLERRILSFEPDFVLVQWFVNDAEGSSTEGRPAYLPLVPLPQLHLWLYDRSALYTLLNTWWSRLQATSRMAGSYPDYLRRRLGDPQSEDSRKDRAAMERLIALCRARGVAVGFVLFPDAGYELGSDYPFGYLHERVLDVCRSERLECLDLRAEFAKVKDRRALWINPLDHHPSAQANMIAAVSILHAFGDIWRRSIPTTN
ncbi:MAG: SGNH/GDSL hydrolase family protein [Vicinamibacterales bacterium]